MIKIRNIKNKELNRYVIANRVKQSDEIATPYGLAMTGESGRSIVEMLGVLAIVGILSIGGVSGYTTAMKKYKANELLNEASKRAAVIAMQIASGQQPSIDEFKDKNGNDTVGNATFSAPVAGNSTFKMTLSGVDEGVCEQMEKITDSSIMLIQGECSASSLDLIFNKDLKRGTIDDSDSYSGKNICNPICQEGKTCVAGYCMNAECKNTDCSCPTAGRIDNENCSKNTPYCAGLAELGESRCASTMLNAHCYGEDYFCGGDAPYCGGESSDSCLSTAVGRLCGGPSRCQGTDAPYCYQGHCTKNPERAECFTSSDCGGSYSVCSNEGFCVSQE